MRTLCFFLFIGAAVPAVAQPQPQAPPATRSCLSANQIKSTTLTDAHEIMAKVNRSVWRNAAGGCDVLRKDRGFVLQSPQARYCSGDIVQVFEPLTRFEYGACTLGTWEKVG